MNIKTNITKSKPLLVKAQPHTARWAVGFWATIWWGFTCAFGLGLVCYALKPYSVLSVMASNAGLGHNIWQAFKTGYDNSSLLHISFYILLAGWIVGGVYWLYVLKQLKLSYKAAFTDLLLTIRK